MIISRAWTGERPASYETSLAKRPARRAIAEVS
jgi:hypothetical protein